MSWLIGIAIAIVVLVAFVFLVKIIVIPLMIVSLKKRALGYAKKRVGDIAAPLTKRAVDGVTQFAKDHIQNLTEKEEKSSAE